MKKVTTFRILKNSSDAHNYNIFKLDELLKYKENIDNLQEEIKIEKQRIQTYESIDKTNFDEDIESCEYSMWDETKEKYEIPYQYQLIKYLEDNRDNIIKNINSEFNLNMLFEATDELIKSYTFDFKTNEPKGYLSSRGIGQDELLLTKLFYNVEQRTYNDWVHYNYLGNQIISEHLAPIILDKAMEKIEKRLD